MGAIQANIIKKTKAPGLPEIKIARNKHIDINTTGIPKISGLIKTITRPIK